MKAILTRTKYLSGGIFGTINFEDLSLVTLEHAYPTASGSWTPKVPTGIYNCTRFKSPRLGYELFQLQNVPGHDGIDIHKGNFNEDSIGCILLGEETMSEDTRPMITSSKIAFQKFMTNLKGIDSFELTVC